VRSDSNTPQIRTRTNFSHPIEAIADGGNAIKITEALDKMAKAEEKIAKGEYNRAVDEFKKGWQAAGTRYEAIRRGGHRLW